MARVGMGLIKNEHGVYQVRRKVPKGLEEATARVMGNGKVRQSWLKETLRTKDEKRARVLAKPVMMKFDRVLAQAEALLIEQPVRASLTETEIKAISDYFYAHELGADEELQEEGIGSDEVFADVHHQLTEAGVEFATPFEVPQSSSGLSDRMMHKIDEDTSTVLPDVKAALARGNIDFIRYEVNELLQLFRINLDPNSPDFRKLALAVMRAEVRALEAVQARHRGEPIESPKRSNPAASSTSTRQAQGFVRLTKVGSRSHPAGRAPAWSLSAASSVSSSYTVTSMWLRSTEGTLGNFGTPRSSCQRRGRGNSWAPLPELAATRESILTFLGSRPQPSTNG